MSGSELLQSVELQSVGVDTRILQLYICVVQVNDLKKGKVLPVVKIDGAREQAKPRGHVATHMPSVQIQFRRGGAIWS